MRARNWGKFAKIFLKSSAVLLLLISNRIIVAQTGIWTWMQGDSIACNANINEPRCVYAAPFWTDTTGNFWVYTSSDLWKYDPQINVWSNSIGVPYDTIRIVAPKGDFDSQNNPGWKFNGSYTWTTPDNELWMYGGLYSDGCAMLWKYSIALNQWAWMGTFSTQSFGTKGIPDSTNSPGCALETNAAWVDDLGNLWMFGVGFTSSWGTSAEGNAMWKYDVSSGWWTWMSGSNNNDTGVYGNIGVPSVSNYPSSRWTNFYWEDNDGNFWVGLSHTWTETDIWKFNPNTLEWTWMSGSPNNSVITPIGALCDTSSTNQIGGRFENRTTWKINDSLIVTHGGQGGFVVYNDVWAYLPFESKWINLASYPTLKGHYGIKGVSNALDYPTIQRGGAGFKDRNNNCWVFSGLGIQPTVVKGNDLWKYEIDWSCLPSYVTGIKDISTKIEFNIYPNPSLNELNLIFNKSQFIQEVRIYNTLGELITKFENLEKYDIDISYLLKGVYIVEVRAPNAMGRKLLLKM